MLFHLIQNYVSAWIFLPFPLYFYFQFERAQCYAWRIPFLGTEKFFDTNKYAF